MIADAVLSFFSSLSLSGGHPRDPAIARMLGFGAANTAGVQVTHMKVLALPAIKRAVQIISDKLYGMPWYVFREETDGREFERAHPAWRCITRQANGELDAQSFRQQMTQWALLWGNACAWIDRNSESGQVELYPLLPDRTTAVRLSQEQAESIDEEHKAGTLFFKTKIGGETKYLHHNDVLHLRGLGASAHWGLDVVELLSECFGGAMAKEEFGNRFFSNGANPVGFLKMQGSLDEESEETYMQSLQKAMSGLGKAHKIILLEEGAEFVPVTIDPQKSQMIEGRQFDVRLLAMAIGIKPHKLIDSANSAFASLEQANHEHKDDDILPWVNKFRVQYQKLLRTTELDVGSHSIDVDDESLDWVPFTDRVNGSVNLYNNGLITKDEGRRKVNFGPSRTRRAAQYRIPSNILYEDDQAIVGTQNSAPEARYNDVVEAYLEKIEKRLTAQAKSKARSSKEFLAWLDTLAVERAPDSIQSQVDEIYDRLRSKWLRLAETCTSMEGLESAI